LKIVGASVERNSICQCSAPSKVSFSVIVVCQCAPKRTMTDIGSTASLPNGKCCICKASKVEPVEQFCTCWYHFECLRHFVNTNQKTTCPICSQFFSKCRIIKRRRSLSEFILTTEIWVTLIASILVILYCTYFFFLILTTYQMARLETSNTVLLFTLVPGVIYLAVFFFFIFICCILTQHQYRFWREHNYTISM